MGRRRNVRGVQALEDQESLREENICSLEKDEGLLSGLKAWI